MIYFDTDILVHYLVEQNKSKHALAKKLYEKAARNETFFISLLSLQETAFVLSKFDLQKFEIIEKLSIFHVLNPVNYTFQEYLRAIEIAYKVGFQSFNDCLHVAIAENYCTSLYTNNKSDFSRIKNFTSLPISFLD